MRLGVLGPLLVVDDQGREYRMGAARQRTLLAALMVRANRIVPVDELAEMVWDGAPTPRAARTLRSYVVRLRHSVGAAVAVRILTRDPGYLCELAEAESDIQEFETGCRAATSAVRSGRWTAASAAATGALDLWRGDPLVDVPSELLRAQIVPRLEQLRLQALEDRAEADLHLGSYDDLVPRLHELTAAHPLRERFHAQLMLALARSGRQADALAVYRQARKVLAEELAVEPGPQLRQLHERVLAGETEPAEQATITAPVRVETGRPVPRQLPAAARCFTGRKTELDLLDSLGFDPTGTVVISAIDGMAGIGKTALAVHWAHQHADLFPDGQLYVNLRGFDPSGEPVPAATAVRGFLDALGVPAQRMPADPDEQAALYRSLLAERRMLVLVDNARDAGQVRPLLPGSPGCLVLVTSRNQLGGLVAIDGAVPMTLDLLTHEEARDLLERRLGHQRLAAAEYAVDELINLCARLPLALNIVAAHAATHPAHKLSEFTGKLRDAKGRLDILTTEDVSADVRAVFSWSYRVLDPAVARVFRLLSVHPGPDIGLATAASLTALNLDRTRCALDALTRAHLISEPTAGRYTVHDLLRTYAAEQTLADDTETTRQDALRRVCDFYVHTACDAERILGPHRQHPKLGPPEPGTRPLSLCDDPVALAWFDAEHPNLLAAQRAAATHGWHLAVWQLAWALYTFHARRAHLHDDLAVWQAAVKAARHLPDPAARIAAHRYLGAAYGDLGQHQEAVRHLHEALALAEQHHDLAQQAGAHYLLGRSWGDQQGDYQQALHHATRSFQLCRDLGKPALEADALNLMGWFAARLGHYNTARAHCQAALTLYRDHDHPTAEAATLDSLGYIEHHTGHHHDAIDHYQRALTRYRDLGNTYQSANTLDHLGHPLAALGQHQQARSTWQHARDLYHQQERTADAERIQRQLDTLDRVNRS